MFAGLIRTLLTIVFVWFVFRWLDRMFGGGGRFRRRAGGGANARSGRGEGNPRGGKKPDDNRVGEYIDYEEIDN
jgi:hypothetical protein